MLVAVLGLTRGPAGMLVSALAYLALSAGWGVVTTRTWWGRMRRRTASAVGAGSLVALMVVASAGASDGGAPAGGTADVAASTTASAPAPSASRTAAASASVDPSPTPTVEPTPTATPPQSSPAPTQEARPGTALAAVAGLTVKGRAPKTGYSRDQFGPAWSDVDRNGCDTRNDILGRDLTGVVTKAGTHGCVVLTGTFADPYSGEMIAFQRGQGTSSLVQIDHVVALSDAWQKGAQQWSAQARQTFANDPLNLLAAKGALNSAKGDGDTATWLPPNKPFRCAYVARQVAVKKAYGVWVTAAERDAMVRVLSACPGEPLPAGGLVTAPPVKGNPAPTPADNPAPAPSSAPVNPAPAADNPAPSDVYYENCTAARAAGAAPLHTGDLGYRAAMDRDKDGVACE